ncbi:hypothetical protein Ancab_034300 [Ancistrocladus abbreviatus]
MRQILLHVHVPPIKQWDSQAGTSGLFKESNSVWIGGYGKKLGRYTMMMAEYYGLLFGLQHTRNLGIKQLEIECYSSCGGDGERASSASFLLLLHYGADKKLAAEIMVLQKLAPFLAANQRGVT